MMSISQHSVDVLTVDDSAQFLDVARELVATTDGFRLVGEAGSGQEGIAAARRLSPDLVLLDVRMPGMDGIETARRLSVVDPRMVILLVSANDKANAPHGVDSCGAAAYVRKQDLAPSTLQQLWATHGT
jgi:two-component system invasion response regulator UvrY